MENKKDIKADFQFIDSYINKTSIDIKNKAISDGKFELGISVAINKIKVEKDGLKIVDAKLYTDVNIRDKENDKVYVSISTEIIGRFTTSNLTDDEFNEFVKYSGIPALSQQVRAYITSISSLSGIEPVIIPMINFENYFSNAELDN